MRPKPIIKESCNKNNYIREQLIKYKEPPKEQSKLEVGTIIFICKLNYIFFSQSRVAHLGNLTLLYKAALFAKRSHRGGM